MELTYDFKYEHKNGYTRKIDTLTGQVYYWSELWKQYLKEYQFTSEHYYCADCLREDELLVKGTIRYDSLVLCDKHRWKFEPVMQKLRNIFDNNPNVTNIDNLGF